MDLEQEVPESFYKYRAIDHNKKLEDDYSIDALIENKMVFSSRTNFNDPFDSKIKIVMPTPKEFKAFTANLSGREYKNFKMCMSKGSFTDHGTSKLNFWVRSLNEILDSYAFVCLSPKPDSNLMWSHYANSHAGFCVEFDSKRIEAKKVSYSNKIASLKLLDCISPQLISSSSAVIETIMEALFCKLTEWEYEEEYRLFAPSKLAKIKKGQKFELITYPPDFVKSVIFGFRMDDAAKKYIMERMPAHVKFKQAYPGESKILIRDYYS
jgi:hypothetical protein